MDHLPVLNYLLTLTNQMNERLPDNSFSCLTVQIAQQQTSSAVGQGTGCTIDKADIQSDPKMQSFSPGAISTPTQT
jgi:hypothetical protein